MSAERTPAARIAVAQYEPRVGDAGRNRAEAVRWTRAAAERGAQLVVLPELASSGYVFESDAEAEAAAEDADAGATVAALTDVCRESGAYVVAGLDERRRGSRAAGREGRYNSAVLLGPGGRLATYRKLHLFNDEKSWFEPGTMLPVVQLPFGRVGMMICFDLWFPEPARALALAGADIIALPTNWVASYKRTVVDESGYIQGDYVAMATAAQNGVVMACADRIGTERGVRFLGASIIVGADGWPLAGPAPLDEPALLVTDIEMSSVAGARRRTPRNHLLEDRRPAYATELIEPNASPATGAVAAPASTPR